MQLTQKESGLLKDLQEQEKLCIDKYTKHAAVAHDPQLSQLFGQLADVERSHLKAINSIQTGSVPATISNVPAPSGNFTAVYSTGETEEKKSDAFLCSDLLATEKHVSHL